MTFVLLLNSCHLIICDKLLKDICISVYTCNTGNCTLRHKRRNARFKRLRRVHTHLRQQDRTQRITGRNRGVSAKSAESLRDSDALMRVAVPRRRGPAGLRDPVAVSLTAPMGFTVLVSRFVGTQKIERLFFSWYKISIAPEADMKPRRLCLFLL